MTSINGSAVLPRADVLEGTAARQTAQDKEEARTIELAQLKLQHFLDNSDENIALCGISLKKLPDNFFEPLQTLFRDPSPFDPDNTEGETEEEFQARGLIPRIRLDLSDNALEIPPLSLFNLQNITTLDLSHNNLTHLSRHIGKLKNLDSLDISSNRLRWLPWELIELFQLRKLHVIHLGGNPFLQPFTYVGPFGPWHQPCYPSFVYQGDIEFSHWQPPFNVNEALCKIREVGRTWRHLQNAKSHAAATKDQGKLPEHDERTYDQAIEHAKLMLRFYINCAVRGLSPGSDGRLWKNEQPQTMYVASTSVVRFGVDGRLLHGQSRRCAPSALPVDEFVFPAAFEKDHLIWIMEQLEEQEHVPVEELDYQALTAILRQLRPSHQHGTLREESAAPSLFELALQSATDIKGLLSDLHEHDPESVRQGVQTAIDVHEEGGRVCSFCSRPFIIARTEWVEYWHLGKSLSTDNTKILIPILRRGCSPNCFTYSW